MIKFDLIFLRPSLVAREAFAAVMTGAIGCDLCYLQKCHNRACELRLMRIS